MFRSLYHETVASLEGYCTGPRPGLNLATQGTLPFPGTECRSPSPQAVSVMTDKRRHYDTLSTPDETCLCACEGYKLIGCDVLLFIHPPSPTRSTQICM